MKFIIKKTDVIFFIIILFTFKPMKTYKEPLNVYKTSQQLIITNEESKDTIITKNNIIEIEKQSKVIDDEQQPNQIALKNILQQVEIDMEQSDDEICKIIHAHILLNTAQEYIEKGGILSESNVSQIKKAHEIIKKMKPIEMQKKEQEIITDTNPSTFTNLSNTSYEEK